MNLGSDITNKKSPWRYCLRKAPQLGLWVLLVFSFRFDIYREDFRFIPYQSTIIITAIFAYNLWNVLNQYWLKVELKKILGFKEWRKFKQIKKQFER